MVIVGPGYFFEAVADVSGRKPIILSKPSSIFNDFVLTKFHIKDPTKILFIGDT